jgi:hypothetical protein
MQQYRRISRQPSQQHLGIPVECKLSSVKGSLKSHSSWWHEHVKNPYILDIIDNGYKLPLMSIPPQERLRNNKTARENVTFVSEEIERLVEAGILLNVHSAPTVVNALTVAQNAAGKLRLVLDLRGVNPLLHVPKFKFEDLKVASQYFSKDCYMCSFDLKSGYSHIDINVAYQQYLGLEWEGKHYTYASLPFGCSSAGLVFSKVVKELVKIWRAQAIPIVTYLDDGILIASNFSEAERFAAIIKADLLEAGFIVNNAKSVWVPTKKLSWLGFSLDSSENIFEIPDEKLFRLRTSIYKAIVSHRASSARILSRTVGKVTSMYHALGHIVYLMTKQCQCWIADRCSWSDRAPLPECVLVELRFWHQNIDSVKRLPLEKPLTRFSRLIYSDASSTACGAFIKNHPGTEMVNHWTVEESSRSSTWRELRAVELFLSIKSEELAGLAVKWYTDNQAVPRILYKGSMTENLQSSALSIFQTCISHDIQLSVDWIPRYLNEAADELSKTSDFDDWGVASRIFELADKVNGPHTLDVFASNITAKCNKFYSKFWCQGTAGVDCFAFEWGHDILWLVPPIHLIAKAVSHCSRCRGRGTLVIPKWESSAFWPMLCPGGLWKTGITQLYEFKNPVNFFTSCQYGNGVFSEARFSSNVLMLRLDFTNTS